MPKTSSDFRDALFFSFGVGIGTSSDATYSWWQSTLYGIIGFVLLYGIFKFIEATAR